MKGKAILVTGGTGTVGREFVKHILKFNPLKIIVFSRGEHKQYEMQKAMPDQRIRFFIGDVRDKNRLMRAFPGVDMIVHTAALKHVEACEYNPFEAIKTNVLGAQNVIEAAIDSGVDRVISVSTDKVTAGNLYGATKLCSDKLFISGNVYSTFTKFSVVRFGNILGSRGSVVPLFKEQKESGVLTITDPRMTRFWITQEQAVEFIAKSLQRMEGGEVFIPKLPSMRVVDLAEQLAPGCRHNIVGLRPGERLYEIMITEDEGKHTVDCGSYYTIYPEAQNKLPEGFMYRSDNNAVWAESFPTLV